MSNKRIAPNVLRIRLYGDECIYCGLPATEDEHWPPYCSSNTGYILPCCRECNALAGTEWPYDFIKRAGYVKEKLKHRLARDLSVAGDLTCEELARQDRSTWIPTLESCVDKQIAERRVAWDALSYIATIDYDEVFNPTRNLILHSDSDQKSTDINGLWDDTEKRKP